MSEIPELIKPYCTLSWANAYFSEHVFNNNWSNSSIEKQTSAIKSATEFIDTYCRFYDSHSNEVFYPPSGEDDFDDEFVPRTLKVACALEAEYLLGLDDNPAEPHPLTVLGLVRGDFGTIDKELVPPILTKHVVKLLLSIGGNIDMNALNGVEVLCSPKNSTF